MEEAILAKIRTAEEKAVLALIADAKDGVQFPKCHPHGRSGGTNPLGYGFLQAVLPVYDRIERDHDKNLIGAFIHRHVEDTVACFWQTMANQQEPPGEYTVIENGVCTSGDWDILRHVDLAGYCDVVRHGDFGHLGNPVRAMAERWGRWLLQQRWETRTRETLRMGLPLNTLVAIYEVTGDTEWLRHAVNLFYYGWGDPVRRDTIEENGDVWTTWDSGYPSTCCRTATSTRCPSTMSPSPSRSICPRRR